MRRAVSGHGGKSGLTGSTWCARLGIGAGSGREEHGEALGAVGGRPARHASARSAEPGAVGRARPGDQERGPGQWQDGPVSPAGVLGAGDGVREVGVAIRTGQRLKLRAGEPAQVKENGGHQRDAQESRRWPPRGLGGGVSDELGGLAACWRGQTLHASGAPACWRRVGRYVGPA